MKNILFERTALCQIPREQQAKRIQAVIQAELTELQRYTIVAYYFAGKKLVEIAEERCVNKSTVSRTMKRAENKLKQFLKY